MFLTTLFLNLICLIYCPLSFSRSMLRCVVFLLVSSLYVQGNVEICSQQIQPNFFGISLHNCTLVCDLKFQYVISDIRNEELALCIKNTSIGLFCVNHAECRQHHAGAYCKVIPCLCKAPTAKETYVFDAALKLPKFTNCVVPAKHAHPEMPIVPFPWKTLLIVAGIVFLFGTCLICLRWLSPILRSMQAKRTMRENRERRGAPEDNTTLFSTVTNQSDPTHIPFTPYFQREAPRIYRANPRSSQNSNRVSARARYMTCAQTDGTLSNTLSNQDKPPPYETAIQLPPPAYEEVERVILECGGDDFRRNCPSIEVHAIPSTAHTPVPSNATTVS